jgi:hypothetical protein
MEQPLDMQLQHAPQLNQPMPQAQRPFSIVTPLWIQRSIEIGRKASVSTMQGCAAAPGAPVNHHLLLLQEREYTVPRPAQPMFKFLVEDVFAGAAGENAMCFVGPV